MLRLDQLSAMANQLESVVMASPEELLAYGGSGRPLLEVAYCRVSCWELTITQPRSGKENTKKNNFSTQTGLFPSAKFLVNFSVTISPIPWLRGWR